MLSSSHSHPFSLWLKCVCCISHASLEEDAKERKCSLKEIFPCPHLPLSHLDGLKKLRPLQASLFRAEAEMSPSLNLGCHKPAFDFLSIMVQEDRHHHMATARDCQPTLAYHPFQTPCIRKRQAASNWVTLCIAQFMHHRQNSQGHLYFIRFSLGCILVNLLSCP